MCRAGISPPGDMVGRPSRWGQRSSEQSRTQIILPLGKAREVQRAERGGLSLESVGVWGRNQPSVLAWKAGCCWQKHRVGVGQEDETGTGGQVTAGTLLDFILEPLHTGPHTPKDLCLARGSLVASWKFFIVLEQGALHCHLTLGLQGSCCCPAAQAQPGAGVGAQAPPTVPSWCVGGGQAWPSGWDLSSSQGRAAGLPGTPFQGPLPSHSAPHGLTAWGFMWRVPLGRGRRQGVNRGCLAGKAHALFRPG